MIYCNPNLKMIINFNLSYFERTISVLKRFIGVVLAITVFFLLSACGSADVDEKSDKIKIVTTAFPQYDLVRQIVGDKAELIMLLPAGGEVHTYDPSVKDIMNVADCDVFVYNGGESDMWVQSVIESSENEEMIRFAFMENCRLVNEELVEGMQHEHGQEEHISDDANYDEHVWTSPVKLSEIAAALVAELKKADPENADFYGQNGKRYVDELQMLDEKFKEVRENAVRSTLVFGDRFPFAYFAKEYDLDYYAAFPGCASNTEASAATLAFLTDKVKQEGINVVFTIEFSDGKIADAVCNAAGARKRQFHSCHNVTKEQLENGVTYIALMEENLSALREAICK